MKPSPRKRKAAVTKVKHYPKTPAALARARITYDSNRGLAQALGINEAYLGKIWRGIAPFSDETRARVAALLQGRPHAAKPAVGGGSNKLVVVAHSAAFEALHAGAIAMGGDWVFKRKLGKDWLGILALPADNVMGFAGLAKGHAKELILV